MRWFISALARLGGVPRVFSKNPAANVAKALIDPVRFKKVITNLLLNAVDALGEGGEIRVKPASARLGCLFQ